MQIHPWKCNPVHSTRGRCACGSPPQMGRLTGESAIRAMRRSARYSGTCRGLGRIRGEIAGHYRLERLLGRGGFAGVRVAAGLPRERPVAVKSLRSRTLAAEPADQPRGAPVRRVAGSGCNWPMLWWPGARCAPVIASQGWRAGACTSEARVFAPAASNPPRCLCPAGSLRSRAARGCPEAAG